LRTAVIVWSVLVLLGATGDCMLVSSRLVCTIRSLACNSSQPCPRIAILDSFLQDLDDNLPLDSVQWGAHVQSRLQNIIDNLRSSSGYRRHTYPLFYEKPTYHEKTLLPQLLDEVIRLAVMDDEKPQTLQFLAEAKLDYL
jgi:hypothetical protein